jgi:hypothetical protein
VHVATGEEYRSCPLPAGHDWRARRESESCIIWYARDELRQLGAADREQAILCRLTLPERTAVDPTLFDLRGKKRISMETAIGTWGTPLQRVFQEQSCTVLGDADGTGRLRACSANDFYAALELWNPSEGVPLCPLPGQLSGLRRAGGRWLWDLLEDQRLTANACIFQSQASNRMP